MGAIDIHTHAFPNDLATRAISSLEAAANWQAVGKGTIDSLMRSMDKADVDISVVCTIATKPGQAKGILKWCRNVRGDRIEMFPSVHPAEFKAARWVQRFAEEGFAGIKLHPMYQDFAFDEPRMDEIYAAAGENHLTVAMHCGHDIAFPDTDDRAAPQRIRRVVDLHPNVTFLCTHMGGWRDWDASDSHLVGSAVYMETSFSLEELGPQRAGDMIRRHGADRVLFGSDWPWRKQGEQLQQIQSLGLGNGEKQAILYRNPAKLLGL